MAREKSCTEEVFESERERVFVSHGITYVLVLQRPTENHGVGSSILPIAASFFLHSAAFWRATLKPGVPLQA